MNKTPLWERHQAAGATMTEFAGYDMPVVYGSIKQEHQTVRQAVGLFDVSHMSNLFIEGPAAASTISAVCPKSIEALPVGKGQYSVILREDGTILDDIFTFRLEEDRFMMVPNAGQNQLVADHLVAHATGEVLIADETRDWAIMALQGPKARATLEALAGAGPKFHHITSMTIADVDCLVSGTGYTGEKGVELYVPAEGALAVWDALMVAGAEHGIAPIGLGARDTLRLEKGYCLAGNEFAGGRTPQEAGLGWLVDKQHEHVGKTNMAGRTDRLVGLVQEKGVPRHGYAVQTDGQPIGVITSGTQSPTTGQGIALAYVTGVQVGDSVDVDVRGKLRPATVVKPPFV